MNKEQLMEFFERAFSSGTSGCYRECNCGIIHFDVSDNGWTWEKGELEGLISNSKHEPMKYVQHDGAVGTLIIDNKEVVIGCTCNTIKEIRDFLDRDKLKILNYITAILNEERKVVEDIEGRVELCNKMLKSIRENSKIINQKGINPKDA